MNDKVIYIVLISLICWMPTYSQSAADNIVIITLDGMRWQEIFNGADSAILFNKAFTRDIEGVKSRFWDSSSVARREKLFPFLWHIVARQGQLYGNRNKNSFVDVSNPYHFSYPGYNEIFTGYPDTAVASNDKIVNKNSNVLTYLNKQIGYQNKVAVFSTWDAFPYILNKWESHIYVNADADSIANSGTENHILNDIQRLSSKPLDVRLDVLTYIAAREYVKVNTPKVLCIGFDETDDYAHKGDYEQYLKSANAIDGMIADLWHCLQSMPAYRGKTTLLITCDHGRGDKDKANWTDHGDEIPESSQIWIAALGPEISNMGEMENSGQLYQKQLAASIARLVGFSFIPERGTAETISSFFKPEKNIHAAFVGLTR